MPAKRKIDMEVNNNWFKHFLIILIVGIIFIAGTIFIVGIFAKIYEIPIGAPISYFLLNIIFIELFPSAGKT